MAAARTTCLCLAATFVAVLGAGCASKPAAPSWPAWVLQPEAAGGVAAAECVEASGNLSLDRNQAASLARVTMARNLEVNIQASDELSTTKTGAKSTQSFKSVAKVLTEKALTNTRVTRLEEVAASGAKWLCAEVSLDSGSTRSLVKQAVETTGSAASPDVEEMLLQQFRRRAAPAQVAQKSGQ
ncbi:MAG: hypothetical protein H7Y33_01575 [Cytophagales bacterium]|nr:hypothetical protein [Rhizobacter sp.]